MGLSNENSPRSVLSTLVFSLRGLSAERKTYITGYLVRLDLGLINTICILLLGMYLIGCVFILRVELPDGRITGLAHCVVGVLGALLVLVGPRWWSGVRLQAYTRYIEMLTFLQWLNVCIQIHYFQHVSSGELWTLLDITYSVTFLLILSSPTSRKSWVTLSFFNIVFPVSIYYSLEGFGAYAMVIAAMGLGALCAKAILIAFATHSANSEFDVKRLTEIVATERFNSELRLARKIQDSLSFEPTGDPDRHTNIQQFQVKHEQVAGDWSSYHRLPSGKLIVIVVDAAGKGVQASLVIHAVQSMWADAVSRNKFVPEKWINRLNDVLIYMGRQEPHCVTLGVLEIEEQYVRYWRAGHVPAFIESGGTIETLLGRGSMLGINAPMPLQPVEWQIQGRAFRALIGTDGVFPRGTLTSRKSLSLLLSGIATSGAQHIEGIPVQDDKTLVIVERLAQAKEAA